MRALHKKNHGKWDESIIAGLIDHLTKRTLMPEE
jgi:hypothetical protein